MKVQENDEASCKSAFQAARSIRADEVKTYQKDSIVDWQSETSPRSAGNTGCRIIG